MRWALSSPLCRQALLSAGRSGRCCLDGSWSGHLGTSGTWQRRRAPHSVGSGTGGSAGSARRVPPTLLADKGRAWD